MKSQDKPRETFESIQYIGTPVLVKGKQVGFAPVPELPEVSLETLRDVGFSDKVIASLAYRMAGTEIRNRVAGKYLGKLNPDKQASTVLEAIGDGRLGPDDVLAMTEQMKSGKCTFTDAGLAILGIGNESLDGAKADQWHWSIMKSVVK